MAAATGVKRTGEQIKKKKENLFSVVKKKVNKYKRGIVKRIN